MALTSVKSSWLKPLTRCLLLTSIMTRLSTFSSPIPSPGPIVFSSIVSISRTIPGSRASFEWQIWFDSCEFLLFFVTCFSGFLKELFNFLFWVVRRIGSSLGLLWVLCNARSCSCGSLSVLFFSTLCFVIGIFLCVMQTINLAAICTPADYNTRPLDTIYSNFIDAIPVVCIRFIPLSF